MKARLKAIAPLLVVAMPSLLGFGIDLALRGRGLFLLSTNAKLGYASHSVAVFAIWVGLIWALARLVNVGGQRRVVARAAFVALLVLVVIPLVAGAYPVQVVYYSIFGSYISHQTISLGIALRGSLIEWVGAWGRGVFASFVFAAIFAAGLAWGITRVASTLGAARPAAPVVALVGSLLLFATGALPDTWVQAPDSSFIGGLVRHVRDSATGAPRAGVTLREGVQVPALEPVGPRRNVILILTESVRFDALCSSANQGGTCEARFLDTSIPDRLGFAKLTSQTSGTLTACMTLWTGLGPEADIQSAHTTPFLWEVARAAGYRTIYVTSQDMRSIDMGAYLRNSGIDLKVVGEEIGSRVESMQLGAPDERATARLVEILRAEPGPYFAVLQLANTHYPYRVDEALAPYRPHDFKVDDLPALKNHYRNAVLLQARTIAELYGSLKALPSWDDTFTFFLSDHGEQFREHGGLFHLNDVYESEVHVPGWIAAGPRALSAPERAALETHLARRVYSEDVHATVLDALGVLAARPTLRHGERMRGRSVLRPRAAVEPIVSLSTVSGVWAWDRQVFGIMSGEKKALRVRGESWQCFDLDHDPGEIRPFPIEHCNDLVVVGDERFHGSL